MEREQVEFIRESRRKQLIFDRKNHKNEETDVRRSLANIRISESNVVAIVNKLKTKSSISIVELQVLQNALVDNLKYIELVLNTNGTLRGLVRELSGSNASKQVLSCGILCNLALGDAKACAAVARAAGAYLVTVLDSCNTQLATNCAWTLGNLAAGGAGAALLAAGGVKLCDVMRGDVIHAALYALTHLVYSLKHDLRLIHLQKMIATLSKTDISIASSQLLFYLSCHKDFTAEAIPHSYLKNILEKLPVSMNYHLNTCIATMKNKSSDIDKTKCCEYIYLIRVLANVNSEIVFRELISYFLNNNLVDVSRLLLKNDADESLWWLFGNVLNCCGENELFQQLVIDL